ncbi:MAG: tetratricopeptide repeat protein [Bacteroidia bacterium]
MKTQELKSLPAICLMAVGLTACNGLSKMFKDANKVTYSVTPNPMQDNGDSVAVNISVKYPAKYFNKKAVVTVTPTLKMSDGTEQALKPVTLVGEKASGSGTKINYDQGGGLTYSDKVAYLPQMKNDELDIKATLENNKKTFPALKIADGTITTARLLQSDDKVILAKDNFQKTIPERDTTRIFYLISQSNVRAGELSSKEMKEFMEFVKMAVKEGYTFDNINISAYASPDGETEFNANLAKDRAMTANKAMRELFRRMDSKKCDTKFGTESAFYTMGTTGMDWEGFKTKVEESKIKDKDLILRVLSMYSDHDQRMKEIKNMLKTYVELADDVLPKLRRAIIILNAEKKSPTDDQLKSLAVTNPESLTVEELLYTATLTNDLSQKLSIYKTAAKQFPNDWRCANNIGYVEVMQNNLADAKEQFMKAGQLSQNNAVVENNLGVIAHLNGKRSEALKYYKSAASAGPDVAYNMGLIDIQMGNYSDAVSNMGSANTFNAALAKLLSNDVAGAKSTLDASNDNSAVAYYLKAIIAARTNNKTEMISNLRTALNKDASLKQQIQTDCEFIKYKDDADFKSVMA